MFKCIVPSIFQLLLDRAIQNSVSRKKVGEKYLTVGFKTLVNHSNKTCSDRQTINSLIDPWFISEAC